MDATPAMLLKACRRPPQHVDGSTVDVQGPPVPDGRVEAMVFPLHFCTQPHPVSWSSFFRLETVSKAL